jgi:hypothetical protein
MSMGIHSEILDQLNKLEEKKSTQLCLKTADSYPKLIDFSHFSPSYDQSDLPYQFPVKNEQK